MANEIFKELKTRIALKYNTYEYWTTGEGKDYAPLKGEVCFCSIPAGNNEATTAPTVLFKVGVDGQTKFSALKWASALAADVYEWAKCSNVELDGEVIKFHNGNKNAPVKTIDLSKFALDADLGDVSTLTTIAKTAVGAINEHDIEIGDLSALNTSNKNNLVVAINEALQAVETGGTGSVVTLVKEDKTTYDEYTLKQGGNAVGDKIVVGKNSLTMKAGNGLSATETTFSSNGTDAPTFEVNHGAKPTTGTAHDTTAGSGRTYVTGIDVDEFGHIAGVKVATEEDQALPTDLQNFVDTWDISTTGMATKPHGTNPCALSIGQSGFYVASDGEGAATWGLDGVSYSPYGGSGPTGELVFPGQDEDGTFASQEWAASQFQPIGNYQPAGNYKTKQTAVTDPTVNGNATEFIASITQNENGEISVTKKKIEASDLGLASAMHFIGALSEAPATAKAGDVYLNTATKKEYVYDTTNGWVELGDEGSHALKTISITGTGYLTGGGTLEANRTIDIDSTVKTKIDHGETAYGWGDHASAGYAKSAELGELASKDDITHDLVTDFDTAVKAVKVDNATDAEKLGGQLPAYYATAESVTDITKENGFVDNKIAGKADKVTGATAGNFAGLDANGNLTDSGKKADDFQEASDTLKYIADNYTVNEYGYFNESLMVGKNPNAAAILHEGGLLLNSDQAQGATYYLKDTITRYNGQDGIDHTYNLPTESGTIATHEWVEGKNYLTEITTTANEGLKVTNKNQIDIDTDVVFVLDCNW